MLGPRGGQDLLRVDLLTGLRGRVENHHVLEDIGAAERVMESPLNRAFDGSAHGSALVDEFAGMDGADR